MAKTKEREEELKSVPSEAKMNITSYVCSACTTAGIAGLGNSGPTAKHAMLEWCRTQLAANSQYSRPGVPVYIQPESHYIFTAGPEEPGHGHSKPWVKYGTEFAQLIEEQGLGKIVTTGAILNKKYHPGTTCQTWLWQPDKDALVRWYEKNNDVAPAAKAAVVNPAPQAPFRPVAPLVREMNGNRPVAPVPGDICPKCKKDWGMHFGWRCPDGGEWPK